MELDIPLEDSGAEVVHLLRQNAMFTSIPSIYHPYDLQHLHFPDFFSVEERRERGRLYSAHCANSRFVVMMTEWAKKDLCTRLGVPETKVAVIPLPPILRIFDHPTPDRIDEVRKLHDLPPRFAFFPAQTWPHKNHLNLLRALAELRDERGLIVPLVCVGTKNSFFGEIEKTVKELQLEEQTRFLGWVDDETWHAIYGAADCLVFPSMFEGWGMPITEAFEIGIPVACTDAPWLPEVMREAVVGFDPYVSTSIAEGIAKVWNDSQLREKLIEEGTRRARSLSWTTVAQTFRAMYRATAGSSISPSESALLDGAGVVP